MKPELIDVLEAGDFGGTFQKLKVLVREAQLDCKWTDHGSFVCVPLDSSREGRKEEMYFWPATGRVLHCCYDTLPPAQQSAIAWRLVRKPEARKRKWRTYKFPKFGELSLPELFLLRPKYAFQEIVYGREPVDELDHHELAELFDKISAIRIPPRFSKHARAVISYSGGYSESIGFEVTEQPVWQARTKRICVANHIDLCDAAFEHWRCAEFFFSPIRLLPLLKSGVVVDARGTKVTIRKDRSLPAGSVTMVSKRGEHIALDRPAETAISNLLGRQSNQPSS